MFVINLSVNTTIPCEYYLQYVQVNSQIPLSLYLSKTIFNVNLKQKLLIFCYSSNWCVSRQCSCSQNNSQEECRSQQNNPQGTKFGKFFTFRWFFLFRIFFMFRIFLDHNFSHKMGVGKHISGRGSLDVEHKIILFYTSRLLFKFYCCLSLPFHVGHTSA